MYILSNLCVYILKSLYIYIYTFLFNLFIYSYISTFPTCILSSSHWFKNSLPAQQLPEPSQGPFIQHIFDSIHSEPWAFFQVVAFFGLDDHHETIFQQLIGPCCFWVVDLDDRGVFFFLKHQKKFPRNYVF